MTDAKETHEMVHKACAPCQAGDGPVTGGTDDALTGAAAGITVLAVK